jgi:hypothetical protein
MTLNFQAMVSGKQTAAKPSDLRSFQNVADLGGVAIARFATTVVLYRKFHLRKWGVGACPLHPLYLTQVRTAILPCTGNAFPHIGNASPHIGNAFPHIGNASPHIGNASPHTGSASPHTGSASSHIGSASSCTGSASPGIDSEKYLLLLTLIWLFPGAP